MPETTVPETTLPDTASRHDRVDRPPARSIVSARRASVALLLILAVALIVRVALFAVAVQDSERFYSPDGREYWALGQDLGAGYGDTDSELFDLGLKRTPGYPVFIAAITAVFDDRESVVVFVQILLSVATVALLYLLVRDTWSTRAALWAAAFLALDPISVIMPMYLQPETPFTLMLVAATVLMVRGVRAQRWPLVGAAGALFGASVLIRPLALYLWVVLIPLTWLLCARCRWNRRLALSGVLALAFAVPVGAWVVRNERATGVATVSTIDGRDLLQFRAAHASAFERGISVREARAELIRRVDRETEGDNAAERSRHETSVAIETLLDHPVGTAVSTARGTSRLVFGPGRAELFRLFGASDPNAVSGFRVVAIGAEVAILLALLVASVIGAVVALRRRRWAPLAIGLGFASYLILVASSGGAFSRYRAPASPYLALLAGIGCAALATRLHRRRTRPARGNPHGSQATQEPGGQMFT